MPVKSHLLITEQIERQVIQRRLDGSEDFYRDWADYKKGFGNVSGEYWLGNDNIFNILNGKSYSFRFDLERGSGERGYAQYETFKIADESEDYRLTLAGYTGTADQEPTDCSKMPMGSINGVYKIFTNNRCINVYCDMIDNGWTVIQRRQDGSVDFYRDWLDYKKGFGNVSGEYWLGNDNIFNILNGKSYSLRFDLENWSDERSYAQYETFNIADESEEYNLTLAGYKGTAGDAVVDPTTEISGQLFSTSDSDNDNWSGGNCANFNKAGWWYAKESMDEYYCTWVNPNGMYYDGYQEENVYWHPWTNSFESMKSVTMKIKHF
ncbi:Ryncolin-2,Angiopoietin-related protein 1,Ficolin-1-A,Angiopoietin-1,Ryncolin-1,Angiopoietin-2,Fibroleukin,Fibrinogen-like protein 1,Ficolin-2,Ficolin-1,Fibrinogen-like protein A,Ficolin-1-B,Fibrinogen gamma chain,Ryncolin-3,Angiopoietin-related protein 2,Ryncolin-4,Techylectin-like protein [Mytilus edulis]|uniref:Fibrinogen C-terminal domain-containing protein n=1 Tax=Mytilus edulis TaxID=6550 RepID=A0A8S3V2D7_MYTED|nr:Ryncolin-2,Angiopoietin-related protein 1,Ficolin-1-A,Angiopoietin-1,Ryncolin-1,Angiopoietin-2,Fibroleukin,Fibrinogen-like protein 1,Ficolin-2,Ficolin-1,Fibrinogen-like protein A,Ficolin-1-B,Fibrinogen gamma chain,Ryncolin-3,Angiopoietin-related protein 2,Ryncolin-4,Techylectin-like protein [Mytilus edulis]